MNTWQDPSAKSKIYCQVQWPTLAVRHMGRLLQNNLKYITRDQQANLFGRNTIDDGKSFITLTPKQVKYSMKKTLQIF
jgi:hypothetical protein